MSSTASPCQPDIIMRLGPGVSTGGDAGATAPCPLSQTLSLNPLYPMDHRRVRKIP